jgi:type IV pilus assembly protein PilM
MFSLGLGRTQAPLLGIDIGSTAVKLVELSRTRPASTPTYRVESCALEPLPPTALVDKKIDDIQAIGEAIRRAVARSGTKARAAAVAVPSSATITKVISMTAGLKDTEMEGLIQLDADQYIPYPLDEVNLDFTVLGPAVTQGEVDVLLVATRHEVVDNLLAALDIAGLQAEVVDVEPYALENGAILAMGAQAKDSTIAITDIGAKATRIQIVRNGRGLFNREQGFAAAQLLEEIQHRYGFSDDEARRRIEGGEYPENFTAEVCSPYIEVLTQQIGRALQFFYSSTNSTPADQILLTGGVAALPGMEQEVSARLGILAYVANPFFHMTLGPRVPARLIQRYGPALVLAVGLALRGFD